MFKQIVNIIIFISCIFKFAQLRSIASPIEYVTKEQLEEASPYNSIQASLNNLKPLGIYLSSHS